MNTDESRRSEEKPESISDGNKHVFSIDFMVVKEHVTQCNSEAPWCVVIDFGTEEGDILDFNTFNVGFGLFMDVLTGKMWLQIQRLHKNDDFLNISLHLNLIFSVLEKVKNNTPFAP